MVFNWFRRKFTDNEPSSAESQVDEPAVEQAESPTESAEETESETPASDPASDYLAWAKAAYQNIQQRQQIAIAPEPAAEEAPLEQSSDLPAESAETTEAEAIANPEVSLELDHAAIAEPPAPPSEQLIEELASPPAAEIEPEIPVAEPIEVVESPLTKLTEPEVGADLVELVEESEPLAALEQVELEQVESEPVEAFSFAVLEGIAPETPEELEIETAAPPVAENLPTGEAIPSGTEKPNAVEQEPTQQLTESAESLETEVPEAEAVDPTPVPFWARAEAERQERLERLKATAIVPEVAVVPESAPSPFPQTQPEISPQPTAPENPAVAFDEGFLWSAEVLASQGRCPEEVSVEEITWLQKLRQGLGKTRRGLVNQLKAVVGQGPLNQDAVLEIESLLLQADVGVAATDTVIQALQAKLRQEALPPDAAIAYLKQILRDILDRPLTEGYSPNFMPTKDCLNIWLMTGVNGVGKTTTIGKIAHVATESGYQCLIGAADTFRAAAVEQVKVWGERSNVEVIANPGKNTDPAAVVFDAIAAAQSRKSELLLIDTAGRLQNKQNLMEELRKIRRIVDKKAPGTKVESLLVLDATLGQNGLRQAQVFAEAAQLTGVVVTKLDGTAKGGVALAVVQQLGLPIRFVGAGEGIGDLRPFSSYEFVEALLSD
jgi:fused signal recognition particle receptor